MIVEGEFYAAVTVSTLIHSSDFLGVGMGEGRGDLRVLAEKCSRVKLILFFVIQ